MFSFYGGPTADKCDHIPPPLKGLSHFFPFLRPVRLVALNANAAIPGTSLGFSKGHQTERSRAVRSTRHAVKQIGVPVCAFRLDDGISDDVYAPVGEVSRGWQEVIK